jgi:tyrosyl-tRNA synthetase
MQVSDIFYLDLDVAHGGMDQRRAHMLAREISKKLGRKSPVSMHTPLLTGLQAGGRMDPVEIKMSKSKPDTMLSIHDDPINVKKKISKAFCPEKQIEGNPVLDICKYIIFPELKGESFLIERSEKFGGNQEFNSYQDLKNAFVGGLHPLDLKNATMCYINRILEPVHAYFKNHPENYEKMKEVGIISI